MLVVRGEAGVGRRRCSITSRDRRRRAHRIGITLGADQPRMPGAFGRFGDGRLPGSPFFPPAAFAAANQVVDDAAEQAGRRGAPALPRRGFFGTGFLTGPPKHGPSSWASSR
ncbi:hypothetical protein AB0F91_35955 [Amycolatopsis sp. NPDC023774]|uniref:hypothetical protein n=1 Tax=Amycolatopsis sp. NPDC023774 TaxID=3155015 RepID=UPI0033DC7AEA